MQEELIATIITLIVSLGGAVALGIREFVRRKAVETEALKHDVETEVAIDRVALQTLQAAIEELPTLRKRIADLQGELEDMREDYKMLRSDYNDLNERHARLNEQFQALKDERRRLLDNNTALRQDLNKCLADVARLIVERDTYANILQSLGLRVERSNDMSADERETGKQQEKTEQE